MILTNVRFVGETILLNTYSNTGSDYTELSSAFNKMELDYFKGSVFDLIKKRIEEQEQAVKRATR